MSTTELPDFSAWTTSRLKFLLDEYKDSLPSVRTLYGGKHPETSIYEVWIKAIETELKKRNA